MLALPRVPALLVTALAGRLGRAASPLALVLVVVEDSGSFAWAGTAAAVLTICDALTTPLKGRLTDRLGLAWVLVPTAMLYAGALAAVPITGSLSAGRVAVLLLAGLAGVMYPPVSGVSKALWPAIVPSRRLLATAYVLESVAQQALFFSGPVLVAAICWLASPTAALVTTGVGTAAGVVGFVRNARSVRRPTVRGRAPSRGGAIGLPVVSLLTATTLLHSLVFGAIGVAVPAAAAADGRTDSAGLVLAAGPVAGLVGSLVIRPSAVDPGRAYVRLMALTALFFSPLAAMPLPAAPLSLFAGGLLVTPIAAITYLLVEARSSVSVHAEAFSWLSTANASGNALGSLLTGWTAEHLGLSAAFLVPTMACGVATVIAGFGIRRLGEEPTPPRACL